MWGERGVPTTLWEQSVPCLRGIKDGVENMESEMGAGIRGI